jgi:AcrR family transcriptional regulator
MSAVKTRRRRLTREEQRQLTRSRLLDAAERLFVRQGFAATSVEQIAEAAGFTRGAFYSNFADKDDIVLAVFDRKLRDRVEEVGAILHESSSLEQAFAAIIRSNEQRAETSELIFYAEFWLYAVRNTKARKKLAEHQRLETQMYERAIQMQFDAAGLEVPIPLRDAAHIVQTLDGGASRLWMIDPDVPRDLFFRAVLELFEAAQALAREKRHR